MDQSVQTRAAGNGEIQRLFKTGIWKWNSQEAWFFLEVNVQGNLGFPGGSVVKNPPDNAGDTGSIPGSGRCPGGGNGNPFQYSFFLYFNRRLITLQYCGGYCHTLPPHPIPQGCPSVPVLSALFHASNLDSGILTKRAPWTEEPGVLQSMGLQRVGLD